MVDAHYVIRYQSIEIFKFFETMHYVVTEYHVLEVYYIFSRQLLKESQNTANQRQKSISIIEVRIQLFGWSDRLF